MNPELAVEERLRRLESQVRRARMWSVATTVALGAVVFASMQAPQAKELIVDSVTARSFRVVDTAGELRGEFGTESGQPNNVLLRLSTGSGAEHATSTLRVRPKDASLQLSGDDRESLAWMWSGLTFPRFSGHGVW